MRRLVAFVVLALASTPLYAQNYSYGWVTSVLSSSHASAVVDSGAGYVRLNFYWSNIEPTDDNFQWAATDGDVAQAINNNLKIYASLSSTPDWAKQSSLCSNTGGRCIPNTTAWSDYVYHVIDRYEYLGDDIVFGIWNEPNIGTYFSGSASDYASLFVTASIARNNANVYAKLGAPEITSGGVDDGWFQSALDHGLVSYHAPQDIMTVHWYPGDSDPLNDTINDMSNLTNDKEIWLTETGYSSCNETTQATQVGNIVNAFNNRSQSNWTKMFMYVLHEQPNGCNYSFGLIDFSTWVPKAGFYTYKNAIP
jgi:hypothetical protein